MKNLYKEISLKADSGIDSIIKILREIETHFYREEDSYKPYYPKPALIFRGIDANYQKDLNHTFDSALCVRINTSYVNTDKDSNKASNTESETYVKADYLNCLSSMVADARKSCPEKYGELNDLHILADIQHNGGATCLVDFSKNVLIGLFFATNIVKDKSGKYQDGYLYCYNYMHDLIVSNNLSVVHPKDESKSIQELVCDTYTVMDYCSDFVNKFRIWDPVALNRRIVRQDSVFVFGIEKFYIDRHYILRITIPHDLKQRIRDVLSDVFNITHESVFMDEAGIAAANGKFSFIKNHELNFCDRCYVSGFDSMIRGNYKEALELFKTYDIKKSKETTIQRKIELCFSLAVCYKNIANEGDFTNIYLRNASSSYHSVIRLIKSHCKKELCKLDESQKRYYFRKIIRAYNEIIELHYEIEDFNKGIQYCYEAIDFISDELPNYLDSTERIKWGSKYLKLTILEFSILNHLKQLEDTPESKSYSREIQALFKKFGGELKTDNQLNSFDEVLYDMMELIRKLIKSRKIQSPFINSWYERIRKYDFDALTDRLRGEIDVKSYMEWSFSSLINAVKKSDLLKSELKDLILQVISNTISIRDMFNSATRIVNNSTEVS